MELHLQLDSWAYEIEKEFEIGNIGRTKASKKVMALYRARNRIHAIKEKLEGMKIPRICKERFSETCQKKFPEVVKPPTPPTTRIVKEGCLQCLFPKA